MPTIPETLHLAEQAILAGDLTRAQFLFERILQMAPDEPGALNGLGVIAFRAGRLDEAEQFHRRAISLFPDNPAFHNNLNLVYCRQGRAAEAVECCRRALALNSQAFELHNNLGIALKQCGQFEPAEASFRRALALKPDYGEAHYNLANTLVQLRHLDEAGNEFGRALELAPADAETRYNRALLRLLLGDFAEGWQELEWRWGLSGFSRPNVAQPQWQGQPLAGRTILLVGEQGLGDIIQMIRFARIVKQSAAAVLVQCRPALRPLLQTASGIDRFVNPGEANRESFDFYVPLLTLPGVLGTTLETIPADVPYLFAESGRVNHWRQTLARPTEFKVGIAWQGQPTYVLDAFRSISLSAFAPLAACPGVKLFSLQKGYGSEQLVAHGESLRIVDLGTSLDEQGGAFVDTAAVMMSLDLVITSDTAIAHLAGALGVPVWVALPFVPDWRWLLDRDDSPWYPTMRLFRQPRFGDWAAVFTRMAGELRTLASQQSVR